MDSEPIDLRPHLVCLNLQQNVEQRTLPDAIGAVLWRVRACLNWARAANMPIVHVHTIRAGDPPTWSPPIRDLEPLHTEVVIAKRSQAAFTDPEWRRSIASKGRRFFLAGLSLDCDVLATALAGAEREARIVLIRDALSIGHDQPSPDQSLEQLCRSPLIGAIDAHELIARYRPRIGF